jgi:hypothetical protein
MKYITWAHYSAFFKLQLKHTILLKILASTFFGLYLADKTWILIIIDTSWNASATEKKLIILMK